METGLPSTCRNYISLETIFLPYGLCRPDARFRYKHMTTIEQLYEIYLKHPSIQTDTRLLGKGDIFFALKGPNFNGNTFAPKALELGAAYAVIDEPPTVKDERLLLVGDVL